MSRPAHRFDRQVLTADWDSDSQRWEAETSQGPFTADLAVSAVGALADPAIPELPGLDTFTGKVFHSARWDHDHDLTGRQVAVVGTGASAIQFVPEIQPRVERLHLFQRTPPWVMPRANPAIPEGSGSSASPNTRSSSVRSARRCSRCSSPSTRCSPTRASAS